jgi:glucosamine-6-phosphate deaminase
MIEGPVAAMCPASALQMHPSVTVVCDEAAAQRLIYTEHYEKVIDNEKSVGRQFGL